LRVGTGVMLLVTILLLAVGCSSRSSADGLCRSETECMSKATGWAHGEVLQPEASVATYESGYYSAPNNSVWAVVLDYSYVKYAVPFVMKVVPNHTGLCGTASDTAKSSTGRQVCYSAQDNTPYYVFLSGNVAYLLYADGRPRTSLAGSPQWALDVIDSLV
jgi:hypothetical protein